MESTQNHIKDFCPAPRITLRAKKCVHPQNVIFFTKELRVGVAYPSHGESRQGAGATGEADPGHDAEHTGGI